MNHAEFSAAALGAGCSADDILAGAVIISDRGRRLVRVEVPSLVEAVDLLTYRFGDNPEGEFTVRTLQAAAVVRFRHVDAMGLRFELVLVESN